MDVATGPKFGTVARDAEDDFKTNAARKRKRNYKMEDIAMNEISDVNSDYHEVVKNNNLPSGTSRDDTYQFVTGSFVCIVYVRGRTRYGINTCPAHLEAQQPIRNVIFYI